MKQKLLSIFLALICTTSLFAYDCVIDGIYYNLNSTDLTAEVTNETGDWQAKSYSSSVVIPSTITYNSQTFSVTTIGRAAFNGCSGLTSVTIPNSITEIGEAAFQSCSGLVSVTIPSSVTSIGEFAFNGCGGLTSITIPNSVTTIESSTFSGCYSLTSVTIPNSVTSIGEFAFNGCSGLTSLTIPNSITEIGRYAFQSCIRLTSFTIPNSVTAIGYGAFSCCAGLTSVTIPNSVTSIGNNAFSGCSGLTSFTIPNSVTTIGNSAFDGCSGLTSFTIPNSVTAIGSSAFRECTGLTSITIPNSVTTIGEYAFGHCSGLTSIDVDAANTHYCSIDGVLFNYAKDTLIQYPIGNTRTEYMIPNSVTTIGNGTFRNCKGLTSVTIPNSVTTIGDVAFDECSDLTTITCYAVTPPKCGDYVFYYISQDAIVYVPASALADYQNAEVWKDLQLYPIAADVTPMDDENPIVTPTDQDVTITWPITDGTDTYTLTITKNGEVVCVLTFNANGQLTNIAFAAPGHNGAHQAPAATLTAQGYQFTVTGLNPGTAYNYSVTAIDAGGKTLAEHKGNFSTTGGTGFESVHGSQPTMHKVLRNGQILLERNNATYTLMGQKVK